MSIRFSCSCGRKLKVSDEKIGMKVLCSSCGATLKVPKKSQDEYWQDVPAKSDAAEGRLRRGHQGVPDPLPAGRPGRRADVLVRVFPVEPDPRPGTATCRRSGRCRAR